jgi:hypothetical protein
MSAGEIRRHVVGGIISGGQIRVRCHERPFGGIGGQLMITGTTVVAQRGAGWCDVSDPLTHFGTSGITAQVLAEHEVPRCPIKLQLSASCTNWCGSWPRPTPPQCSPISQTTGNPVIFGGGRLHRLPGWGNIISGQSTTRTDATKGQTYSNTGTLTNSPTLSGDIITQIVPESQLTATHTYGLVWTAILNINKIETAALLMNLLF